MLTAAWFLLYTKPRQENLAERHLERQGYRMYLPRTVQRRRLRGRWHNTVEPLFPRYIFINLDEQRDNWGALRSTIGVSGLVRFGASPARVPSSLIDSIKGRADGDGLIRCRPPEWVKGERVRIVDGVLAGHEAIFETRTSGDRVKVLMELVGSYATVDLYEFQLARAS